ncbi:hypothetical protein COCC4DRAFT_135937 [Bipolaris maydis ATCC 48331]|uniref:Uncharacterized protein n=2 Tax=Cochliobolus heterostrophus TaxID=5016 RepID=M2T068_COCH5|nr:uncharacterized protein COCC4DRAFT_135937 [Bipolaris maydis ATCC 48331]EMD91005.1 hypothetical protein COCHEDRAFT_1103192 [Bipolaris maydis C5]ENI05911.1 hypothetical protein COCC4DRAFT_135937 [Bipolaris maydis ATCC 48331]KAJ6205201.1 hypothetical protein PSV09DRAFT_1103192 [Bipolaris maydis]
MDVDSFSTGYTHTITAWIHPIGKGILFFVPLALLWMHPCAEASARLRQMLNQRN